MIKTSTTGRTQTFSFPPPLQNDLCCSLPCVAGPHLCNSNVQSRSSAQADGWHFQHRVTCTRSTPFPKSLYCKACPSAQLTFQPHFVLILGLIIPFLVFVSCVLHRGCEGMVPVFLTCQTTSPPLAKENAALPVLVALREVKLQAFIKCHCLNTIYFMGFMDSYEISP